MRILERTHPLCCFLYILAVLCVTIFTRNPVLLMCSAVGASLLLIFSEKGQAVLWLPLVVLLSAVTNPIFSHNGDTVLFFVSHLPVTTEAIAYGAVFGLMLAASVGWSIASVRFITGDKYVWLFGRLLPVSGLVLSCALRLIPLFIRRGRDFAASQNATTVRSSLKAFSASVGYSAEQAMTTADVMRARGYGTARRTSYSLYRLGARECVQLFAVLLLGGASVSLTLFGAGRFDFYPVLSEIPRSPADIALYTAFAALTLLPCAAVIYENFRRRKTLA